MRKVLEYRQLTKLKGTYVDALPALIDPATGRLHTSFNQAGAATGRLSSSNPNLQNIPIRTELGREIRAAFVPRQGWKLLVADYSQIELRLLAHMSGDRLLVEAFRNGEDIHTRTAAEVLGVPPLMVTPEARRNAKAVNFGIVYGISAFGLAAQLGISRAEAEKYIENYFERYAGVRRFIDDTIAEVRQTGVTRTLFGRERPIPDINSRNPNARGFAERTAVNSPLQGTAADLIKLAMVRIDAALAAGGYQSRDAAAGARRTGVRVSAGGGGGGLAAGEARDGRRLRVEGAAGGGYRHRRQLARREVESTTLIGKDSVSREGAKLAQKSLHSASYGITISTRQDGCATSWYTVWLAFTSFPACSTALPVFELRSKRGKLLLEISRRIRWPFRNTLPVTPASIVTR